MNSVDLNVSIRGEIRTRTLVLFRKIYSTPYGIVNYWSTNNNSEYKLEVIIDEDDLSVNPEKIRKSMNIINDEWDIADKMMLKLYESGHLQLQNTKLY